MAALSGTAEQGSPKAQHQRHRRGKRNVLFYAMVVFAVCWIQLTANVIVYFLRNGNHSNLESRRAGRFPLQPRALKSEREPKKVPSGNLRLSKNKTNEGKKASLTVSLLEAELLELSKRLERVQKNVEDTVANQETGSSSETEKVFFPFTIRDAQRTVPTQIPYGFEVFDFIDLYATNGDQNQTATLHSHNKQNAKFYRNGKPISVDDRLLSECLGYSKRCYRSKLLSVIRYLLSLHNTHKRKGDGEGNKLKEYYYFYMEADNDLCVPLSEIRDIAFEHQRYFVSTGTGASGWIMSHRFLEDFYFFWKNLDENNMQGMTGNQILEPDSVAAVLLEQNMAWSVTRRYLTSHSILTGNSNDAASIRALFQRVDQVVPNNADSAAKSVVEEIKKTKKTKRKKKETPEEAAKNAPLMEPSRYLPRCLEPHRGVWRNKMDEKDVENDFDVHHWGFFDYDLCPDSDIFPCAEGQLKELAKKDPYFHKKKK
eukprot:CAMPEP_0116091872 /NCGR_PEP_ID=MMETSP0327-20121206/7737_1 /TAXON_ID=44447 /ORGANISM="Pseudo-nitzschia delicatissima, Strain B596" /LENGTH=483 /DNA_ID=CAMNT_0003583253 /DNA_START=99 /DNA_END=1550 /DNA_ORIENTATION=-